MAEANLPRFYVASSEPAGCASSCACGKFFKANESSLALAKNDQLEIMGFAVDGLKILAVTRLGSAVTKILTIHPSWARQDLLFVLLKNYDVLILEFNFDSQGRPCIETVAAGSVHDKVGRPSDIEPLVAVDPESRCLALHIYQSLIRIIPLKDATGPKEIESFNMRVEEHYIGALTFLSNAPHPTLAFNYKDPSGTHITSYEVDFREKELKVPKNKRMALENLEADTLALFAIPETNQGVVACGLSILTYVDVDGVGMTAGIKRENQGVGVAYTMLQNTQTATKILAADLSGALHVIHIKKTPVEKSEYSRVVECSVILLGRLTIASCLTYLDNGVVFVGSRMTESFLIRLRDDPHPDTDCLFEVIENMPNVGCMVDFALVRPESQGTQPQMVVCSGFGVGSKVRIIRSGIGMQELTSLDAPTGRQIFGINSRSAAEGPHDWLVVSFLSETKVLKMEDEIGEFDDLLDVGAFIMNEPTQLAAKIAGLIVQVTKKSIRAVEPGSLKLQEEWFPAERTHPIGSATFYKNQIVAAALDTLLVVHIGADEGPVTKEVKLNEQISAVDIHSFTDAPVADYIVAATWKQDIIILTGPDWTRIATVDLGSDFFARSVMLQQLDNINYVIAGLGDGTLQYFVLDRARNKLGQPKRVNVGTQPTYLKSFVTRGTKNIFICNDRPSVIHSSGGKLIFSNVNMKHIYAVCQLNNPVYANSLAIITESGIVVGKMDEIQKLHIRSVALPGYARRVAYQPETGTYGFVVMDEPVDYDQQGGGDSEMVEEEETPNNVMSKELPAHRFLVTDQTNYQVLAAFPFNRMEVASAMTSGNLGKDSRTFYIVGTAICKKDEKECSNGRLLILQYADKALTVVSEKQLKGMPTQISIFKEKLLISCGSSLRLMSWNDEGGELVPEQVISHFILPTFFKIKGDFILVGDLMRSLTVLVYRSAENKFDIVASDPYPRWPSTAEFIDDDVYALMDDQCNLLFFRREVEANSSEMRDLVEVAGMNFHDIVNVMKKGTLLPDTAVAERPYAQNSLILGSQGGAVMHVLNIDENTYHILKQLSDKLVRNVTPFERVSAERYNAVVGQNGTISKPSRGVINGDLIEMIGTMNSEEVQEVIAGVLDSNKVPVTVEQVTRLVEDLSRSH